ATAAGLLRLSLGRSVERGRAASRANLRGDPEPHTEPSLRDRLRRPWTTRGPPSGWPLSGRAGVVVRRSQALRRLHFGQRPGGHNDPLHRRGGGAVKVPHGEVPDPAPPSISRSPP